MFGKAAGKPAQCDQRSELERAKNVFTGLIRVLGITGYLGKHFRGEYLTFPIKQDKMVR